MSLITPNNLLQNSSLPDLEGKWCHKRPIKFGANTLTSNWIPLLHTCSCLPKPLEKIHTSYFNFLFYHSTNYIFQIQGPLCYQADQNKTFTKITHRRTTTHITNKLALPFCSCKFSCHWLKISLALLLSMNFLQLPHKFTQKNFQDKSHLCPLPHLLSLCQHFTLNVNRHSSLAKMEPTKWTESL